VGLLPTDPAARFIARFAELALTAPWERFVFEANPVLWRRDDAVALDGLLIVGPHEAHSLSETPDANAASRPAGVSP
jgi:hypothetical protein